MAFARFRRVREVPEVNLIPVMNLFVVLIPFLLMSAAFYHVGIIPASVPSQTSGSSDIAAAKDQVTVNLVLDAEGIRISASSAVLDQDTLDELSLEIPRNDKGYDLDQLARALLAIKLEYPASDTLILLPTPEVAYQDIVRVLDTAREFERPNETGRTSRVALFPVVVLSSMVQEE